MNRPDWHMKAFEMWKGGHTPTEISKLLGFHPNSISKVVASILRPKPKEPRIVVGKVHNVVRKWKPRASKLTPAEVEAQAKRRLDLITSIVRDNPDGPIASLVTHRLREVA